MILRDMFSSWSPRRLALAGVLLLASRLAAADSAGWRIALDPQAEPLERFAARELQRYVYVTTGAHLPISDAAPPADSAALVVTSRSRPLAMSTFANLPALAAQEYWLHAGASTTGPERIALVGGDALGALYAVYRFAERLGVRFYLHGDVIPDARRPFAFPAFTEAGRPLFNVRGLQPFHDFAEGPDWWNADDYLAVAGQLAKLRMNFLGLHTYPESGVGPEPTVWIGPADNIDEHGRVRRAYPASYHTTGRSGQTWWAYAPTRTSDFAGGAAELFDRDDFGADVMRDREFRAQTPETAADVFNRTGELLATAFREARRLGILTCIGTETPLTIPSVVKAELLANGKDPADAAVVREVYQAMFERIRRVTPVDYYWLWTPEDWTWAGNRPEQFAGTAADIQAALDALAALNHPMTLATCGWVLGPQHDRAALDQFLPLNSPMSAINASVGHVAIDRQFTNLGQRPRWAMPWLENDGNLTSPQLWAGRMRFDAADARRLGCTGLIGIHWRTRVLAPQISALAAAAWDQSWVPADFDPTPLPPLTASGASGGRVVTTAATIADAPEPGEAFRTNRVGMPSFDILVPGGRYDVRLGFSEIENLAPGARVFSVKLNGRTLLDHFDVAARAGANRALVLEFKDVAVDTADARLLLEFVAHAGEPAIAFIEFDGHTSYANAHYARRINCGGPALADCEADQLAARPRPPIDRTMPVVDFYRDFSEANFGPEAAGAIGEVLARIDGVALPMPTHWIDGPGDIRRNPEPWASVAPTYAFVGELEALRQRVRGAANLDRYDYWLNQFRALRLIAEIGCTAGALDLAMRTVAETLDPAEAKKVAENRALPLRLQLAHLWTDLLRTEIAGVSNPGEFGTLANLEQRSRVHQQILGKHDAALVKSLGCDLPLAASPENDYTGPARIVVPTVRTAAAAGESLTLRVILVSEQPPAGGSLAWRPLGASEYRHVPLRHVDRRVYEFALPPLGERLPAIEFHLEAELDGAARRWPVSERGLDQTIVLADGA